MFSLIKQQVRLKLLLESMQFFERNIVNLIPQVLYLVLLYYGSLHKQLQPPKLRAQEHYRLWIADAIIPVNSVNKTMFSWTFRRRKKDAKHKIVAPLSLMLTNHCDPFVRRHPFSRSYRAILPSSLERVGMLYLPTCVGFGTGTGTLLLNVVRAFPVICEI
ncbi:hypothetical protein H5410_023296 [Solanum commersonii]|uniref:Uncharacterized protein n=1 Tax=Solanum commersonii TaxID=4109 RepID=A0A9J5ZIT1_SOLCO|nr:hypothetical protein H5410_023296 [Solanum commersonii]